MNDKRDASTSNLPALKRRRGTPGFEAAAAPRKALCQNGCNFYAAPDSIYCSKGSACPGAKTGQENLMCTDATRREGSSIPLEREPLRDRAERGSPCPSDIDSAFDAESNNLSEVVD